MKELTDEELNSITLAIYKRYGVDFRNYEPVSLKRRMARAMRKLGIMDLTHLWMKMLREREFIYGFIDEITVGLTSLFRDTNFWIKLKEIINSEYNSGRKIRVWIAGCSTGEEVYTLSILLQEEFLYHNVEILATDINGKALQTAEEGRYHVLKYEEFQRNYSVYNPKGNFSLYTYFEDGALHFRKHLLQNVTFANHNLMTSDFEVGFDLILCRNVMIYFDEIAKNQVINKFYTSLNDQGRLIFGFYDSMMSLMEKSRFAEKDYAYRIFRKQVNTHHVCSL